MSDVAFEAKWKGDCRNCDEGVLPGQQVEFDDDRNLMHIICPESLSLGQPRPVCPRCFLELTVTGVCSYCDEDA